MTPTKLECDRAACPADKPALHLADEKGMYLEVTAAGGKYWRMKYRHAGKESRLALRVSPAVSLARAREGLAQGDDPELFSSGQICQRCAAWYPKPQATFSDTIAGVRSALWSHAYFSTSCGEADMVKIPRPLLDRFIDSLCYAA